MTTTRPNIPFSASSVPNDPLIIAVDVSSQVDQFGQLSPIGVDMIVRAGYGLPAFGILVINLGTATYIAEAGLIRMALAFVHLDLVLISGWPAQELINRIRAVTTEAARFVLGGDHEPA